MASNTITKWSKACPGKELLSKGGQAVREMTQMVEARGDKQWAIKHGKQVFLKSLVPKAANNQKQQPVIKAKYPRTPQNGEMGKSQERDEKMGKDREKRSPTGSNKREQERSVRSSMNSRAHACTKSLVDKGSDNEIINKFVVVFTTLQSMVALELKVKFSKYSLSLQKVAGRLTLVQCRLVLDAEDRKIKIKVRKSSALARLIPTPVGQAITALNALISRLPLNTKGRVFQLFKTITTAFVAPHQVSGIHWDAGDDDATSDPSSNDIISGVSNPSCFLNTLRGLDIRILCSPVLNLELKKREMFSKFRRKTAVISVNDGLEIVKEPRALFGRREFNEVLNTLAAWVESCPEFQVAQQVAHMAEILKDARH